FDAGRPVGGEAIFQADADHATPTRVIDAVGELDTGAGREHTVAIGGHGGAALDVEQDVVHGVADLTGEQSEGIDASVVGERRSKRDHIAAVEVSPVALRFHAEHPRSCLPAVADLTTDGAAGCVMATLRESDAEAGLVPTVAARSPAAI